MPAWKEAEGGITLCADTEVGIRWALLGEKKKKKKKSQNKNSTEQKI